ncbi:hypothetical protein GIB67_019412 [Kingdonia uniflora]|uniref:AWS domain-containing protein n=1 Tax=Kingdonia uniflora TaxID=39325 RepID=A0A7J7MBN0_9MAGN|nr:hypothetical protein GIB67_019412 [Kingdonia uniflora]
MLLQEFFLSHGHNSEAECRICSKFISDLLFSFNSSQAECRICSKFILSGEEVVCRVHGCGGVYHITCAKKKLGLSSSRSFKCPQHVTFYFLIRAQLRAQLRKEAQKYTRTTQKGKGRGHYRSMRALVCFICKQNRSWRCTRCTMASHKKCAPWPWQEKVTPLANQPGRVCWKHPTDWRWEKKEIFCRLPVPYNNEEFKIDLMLKGIVENEMEPTPFVHIRRSILYVYLVKKKRNDADADNGCSNCDSATCSEDCVCRGQYISCSKACHCSGMCTNRPFRKEKKVKLVKTHGCGWGVVAAESIKNEEFVVEYIGEDSASRRVPFAPLDLAKPENCVEVPGTTNTYSCG